jgi:hypothetical protein
LPSRSVSPPPPHVLSFFPSQSTIPLL